MAAQHINQILPFYLFIIIYEIQKTTFHFVWKYTTIYSICANILKINF